MERKENEIDYQVSCNSFAALVRTDENGIIIFAAPILSTFKGQNISNLYRWLENKFGDYESVKLH